MKLQVVQLRLEADDVVSVTLRSLVGESLPGWSAGAHVPLTLPSGLVRQYSLCGTGDQRDTYTVAVLRLHDGRGGSREVHDVLRVGDILEVGEPRNDFALEPALSYLLIAGGIGITPILSMAESLAAADDPPPSRLVYGARTRSAMAFVPRIESLQGVVVDLLAQDVDGFVDLEAVFSAAAQGTGVYCCGPPAMLAAVRDVAARHPDVVLHLERFGPAEPATSSLDDSAVFEVELARSGVTIVVPEGKSVLDSVLEVVPDAPFSCMSGFCGTCETKVLSGSVDHRDDLLTDAERESNETMMICVSRARNGCRLVLDL